MSTLTVYIPTDEAAERLGIAPGSAICGSTEGERIRIDYEGDIYGRASMRGYAKRLLHAAGRHVERYPTVARAWVRPEDLIIVGTYDTEREDLHLSEPDALLAWLGSDHFAPEDLVAPTRRAEERQMIITALRGDNPIAAAVFAMQRGHEDLVPPDMRHIARQMARHTRA